MSEDKKGILGKVFGVSGIILLSRFLGLLRVRLEAEVLGGGAVASAWHLAFALPNMFRRLLGEGALGNALMPIVAELEKKHSREDARGALAVVFPVLGLMLAIIVIVISAAGIIAGKFVPDGEEFWRVRMLCLLLPLLMPYAVFICLVGAATAVVNYAKMFIFPACCSLVMNLFLIGGLLYGWYDQVSAKTETLEKFLVTLSFVFLASGVLQLLLMWIALKICGFTPDFSRWRSHAGVLKSLWHIAAPGMIGAGALQISFLIDRALAIYVNDHGVAALTYVDRLIDLPIAVFAVAMGQVLMARMTRSAADGDIAGMTEDMNYGLRQVLFLCVPMAAGVFFFHELMLKVICLGGNYTASDLDASRTVAIFYGLGVPFFCALKILQPAFFARKDMKTPLYCSLCAIGVNVALSIALIKPLAQGGIALATVISAVLNICLLSLALRKQGIGLRFRQVGMTLCRSVCWAVAAGWGVNVLLVKCYHGSGRIADFSALAVAGTVFAAVYLAGSHLTGGRELRENFARFHRK